MKLDPNMEIDRLLHRHARRSPAVPTAFAAQGESGRDGEARRGPDGLTHLDADELSAYAENALPERTRARYTEHLADCDSCRKLVTELVLASGVAAELEREAAPHALTANVPARSWRERLAFIFAPRNLRYAASVLAVVGIAAIALMVYRSGERMKFNAGNSQTSEPAKQNETTSEKPVAPPAQNGQAGQTGPQSNLNLSSTPPAEGQPKPEGVANINGSVKADGQPPVTTEQQKSGEAQAPLQSPAPASAPPSSVAGPDRASRDQDEVTGTSSQPSLSARSDDQSRARKEADAANSTGTVTELPSKNVEQDRISKTAKRPEDKTQFGSNADSTAGRKARRGEEAAAPKDNPAAGASMDARAEREDRPAAKKAEERRSVGGKQFVRRSGVWTDTAYSSQATTNVRRGSEQYRALAADEPGLRSIADQLGGEVLIVWKGRAYRIR